MRTSNVAKEPLAKSNCVGDSVTYRELLKKIEADGWKWNRTKGSHEVYYHPAKPGLLVVPGGGKNSSDVPKGTLESILKQAGLK